MNSSQLLLLPLPRFAFACSLPKPTLSAVFSRRLLHQKTRASAHQQGLFFDGDEDRYAELVGVADELLLQLNSSKSRPGHDDHSTLYSLMLCFAQNGLLPQALAIWDQLLNSSSLPSIQTVSKLFDVLSKRGQFAQVAQIMAQLSGRNLDKLPQVYSLAISCFGNGGQLELMESTVQEMVSKGLWVDAATANAYVRYYSVYGSLTEMEVAYNRLKRSRYSIDEEGIRAVALAYLKQRKLYRLGEFLREVGLGRSDVGNLLWNLLLLSYAANFKMKTLQKEFLRMIESGFKPDLTTFNVRAMAFSRMSLLWDLHLSLQHMKHEMVVPDIVTYGCVVDAYLDRRLGRNLDFVLSPMNLNHYPIVLTDPLVFEVLGKGDFHSSSEAFLEFTRHNKWTYRKLIAVYKKKQYRRNQVFWNY
ncbi:Pentatricopeptide repeat [Parasponia andersonii]|uniref:Pentatricopeptide repeat n=1 Tax=Parasponia andersonii TaxID=3476 RepID=A0A2P5AX33_PARAD|nr:Pentatricopeptide repeat [Parasponia andersonii]